MPKKKTTESKLPEITIDDLRSELIEKIDKCNERIKAHIHETNEYKKEIRIELNEHSEIIDELEEGLVECEKTIWRKIWNWIKRTWN